MPAPRIYTSRSEANKAFASLCGIIEGISADQKVNLQETYELDKWLEKHSDLGSRVPFQELVYFARHATQDGEVDQDELEEIKWVIEQVKEHHYFDFYDLQTQDVQRLLGFCHGVMADGVLSDAEIRALAEWVGDNGHLAGIYPWDELVSILTDALADDVIEEHERNYLMAFLNDLITLADETQADQLNEVTKNTPVRGICALDPEIEIIGKTYVITGDCSHCSRLELKALIVDQGGRVTGSISGKTDFLIVGDEGSEAWTYACYGRKIEKAIERRKEGQAITIVHVNDFFDWLQDNE